MLSKVGENVEIDFVIKTVVYPHKVHTFIPAKKSRRLLHEKLLTLSYEKKLITCQ